MKTVGYWNNSNRPDKLVDPSWDAAERALVIAHIRAGKPIKAWRGVALCRICNAILGSTDDSDGAYVWPAKFDHYLAFHHVKPPQAFIDHVKRRAATATQPTLIVKVQRSIVTSADAPQMLFTSEDGSICYQADLTDDVRRALGHRLKRYFHARLVDTIVHLDSPAPDQDW